MRPRVLRKANVVVAGVVVAVGASATGVALTRTPSHRAPVATHVIAHPATKATSGPTTTVTLSPTTSTTAAASPPTTATPATTPPTTSPSGPPPCQWSNFGVTLTSTYSSGDTVPFTITARNDGPACTDAEQSGCDCWNAYVQDSSGAVVWTVVPPTSSIKVTSPPSVLPSGWSMSQPMEWDENRCTDVQNCSPSRAYTGGAFEIFGQWAFRVQAAGNAITSAPLPVEIAG